MGTGSVGGRRGRPPRWFEGWRWCGTRWSVTPGDVAAPFDATDRLGNRGEALVDQLTKRGTQRRHAFCDGIHLGRAVRYLLGRHHMHRPIVSQIVVLTTVTTFEFDVNLDCDRLVAVFAPG